MATRHTTHQTDAMTETQSTHTQATDYDVVVIGAGPVGENVADRTRAAGLSTAVVESELVGGECSYWACMPSKALLRPVLAQADARRLPGLSASVQGPLDTAAVLARRDSFTSGWKDDGQVQWLEGTGADLYRGQGRLSGPRTVTVTGPDGRRSVLTARHAVAVCTGSRAQLPDLPGLDEVRPWTSREATSARSAPGTRSSWWAAGSSPSRWPAPGRRSAHASPSSCAATACSAGWSPSRASWSPRPSPRWRRRPYGHLREGRDQGERHRRRPHRHRRPDRGRRDPLRHRPCPRTDDIGLETIGLEPGSWLDVDDSLRVTGHDWLYAVGDVNHRALLTHQGKYQARIAGAAIVTRAAGEPVQAEKWGAHTATADRAAVPQVVFTDPEAASVGLTLAEAEQAGHRVRAVDVDLSSVAGASLYGDGYRGRARMVVDLEEEIVRGVTLVGPGVGELIHAATVAVAYRVPVSRLWHAVPSYPTISEVWLRLLEAYRDA